jgi:hypothetical protein
MFSESTKAVAIAGTRRPMTGADFRNGTMGWTSSAAIGAGWYVSPLHIDARTGVIVGAVLFDAESDAVPIVDRDAAFTGNLEDGEQGEAE